MMKAREILIEAFRLLRHSPVLALPTLAIMMGSLVLFALLILSALAYGGLAAGGFSPESMGNAIEGAAGAMKVLLVLTAVALVMAHGATVAMVHELMKSGATSLDAGFRFVKHRLVDAAVASFVMTLAIGIGTMLFVIPGIVILFFLMFTFPAMVRDETSAFEGIRGSILAVKTNISRIPVFFASMCGLAVALWVVNALVGRVPLVGPVASLALTSAFGGYFAAALLQAYQSLGHEPETRAEEEGNPPVTELEMEAEDAARAGAAAGVEKPRKKESGEPPSTNAESDATKESQPAEDADAVGGPDTAENQGATDTHTDTPASGEENSTPGNKPT